MCVVLLFVHFFIHFYADIVSYHQVHAKMSEGKFVLVAWWSGSSIKMKEI